MPLTWPWPALQRFFFLPSKGTVAVDDEVMSTVCLLGLAIYLPEVQSKLAVGFRTSCPCSDIVEPIVLATASLKQYLHIGNDCPLREHNIKPIVCLQDIGRVRPLRALRTGQARNQTCGNFA